jgi:CheY-like chemotaxis protein
MVEAHGGMVLAESAGEGEGSTFTVSIPMATATPAPTPADETEPPITFVPQLEILIVDDDGDVRELLTLLLEAQGAMVTTVSSAAEALDAIDRRRPHVLLSDVRFPDEDGYSLIQKLRVREREQTTARIPAIAVTAYAGTSDRDDAVAAGYDAHVPKPIHPDALLRAIARVCGLAHA